MEITIESLIAGLTKNYKPTDTVVVTWWSKDDVNLLLDEEVSDSDAQDLWDKVSETFGHNLDSAVIAGNEYLYELLTNAQSDTNKGA